MPSLVLKPGMFVRLKRQPWDLPDFVLEHWQGEVGWIRQQAWGPEVYLRIRLTELAIPGGPAAGPTPNGLKLITVVESGRHPHRSLEPTAVPSAHASSAPCSSAQATNARVSNAQVLNAIPDFQ